MTVVTISATYGAGGRQIGERVASALQVPFLAHTFTSEQMEAEVARQEAASPAARYARHRIRGDEARDDAILAEALTTLESSTTFETSDAEVRALLDTGGVVVGRAGPHLLRDAPGVLHVLVDGPTEARIAQGAELEGVDRETAARRQRAHDASRLRVARQVYGADPADIRYFHLILDITAIGLDDAVDIVLRAAQAHRRHTGEVR